MSREQTKIDEVAAQHATVKPPHRADDTRARGSMEDVEAAHGVPPVNPAAVKAKAAKARIDCAKHGVEDRGAPATPQKPVAQRRGGRKPVEPRE